MRRTLARTREQRGASLIEFALILPLLLLLTFGIWTTARAWNVHNVMDHAVREAARIGATTGDVDQMATVAQGETQAASVDWGSFQACFRVIPDETPCPEVDDPTSDDRVQASLVWQDYELDFLFFAMTVDLQASAVARLEPGAGT